MKKLAIISSLCLLIIFLMLHMYSATFAEKDTEEQISTVTLIIQPAANLGILDNNVTETLTANVNLESAFDNGFVEFAPNKPTLIVNSNDAWKLSAHSSGFTGPYNKPANELELKDAGPEHVKNGYADYSQLATEEKEIAAYDAGVRNELHPMQYRIMLDYKKDIPGTYQATVTYTLSTKGS